MKVLVTGSGGFVGGHLTAALERSGHQVLTYDMDSTARDLEERCGQCEYVFHLAAVSRPADPSEYESNNLGITRTLLELLERRAMPCPVMLSSSIQASLLGRFEGSLYGQSKLDSEALVLDYGKRTGQRVLVYRFPNLFGPGARVNCSSVVATFCHNIARGLPIRIDGRDTRLELLYIDDLIAELMAGLEGRERRCEFDGLEVRPDPAGRFCQTPPGESVTLGQIADTLEGFQRDRLAGRLSPPPADTFVGKLYKTFVSYLPQGSGV